MAAFNTNGISEKTARAAVSYQPKHRSPGRDRRGSSRNIAGKILRYKAMAIGALAVFAFVIIMYLFSLPVAMFETSQSFVRDAGEWTALSTAVSEKWAAFKNSRTTYSSEANETDDISTLDSEDVFAAQAEGAQTDALMTKVQFTIDKSKARAEALAKEGALESCASSTVAAAWSGYKPEDESETKKKYDYTDSCEWYWDTNIDGWNYWKVRTWYTTVYKTKYVYGGVNFNLAVQPLSKVKAVSLLCTATVAEGAGITNMDNSDYALWLGYKPGFLASVFGEGHRVTASLGDFGSITVRRWDGTCLPVCISDWLKESEAAESVWNKYYRNYGCAALDALVYISTPDLSSVMSSPTESSSVSTSTSRTEAEHTVTVEYAENSAGEKYVKTHSEWEDEEITTVTETVTLTYNVTFTIGYRDAEILNDLMGFTIEGFEPEEET